jgi:hypothetical protein
MEALVERRRGGQNAYEKHQSRQQAGQRRLQNLFTKVSSQPNVQ